MKENAQPWSLRWFAHGGPDYRAALDLRREILRRPLGLEFTGEDIAAEAAEYHLGLFEKDGVEEPARESLVGTLILRPLTPASWQMRQVAVAESRRGRNGGALLVEEAERRACHSGVRELVLHARSHVVGFYERLGYTPEGGWFTEVTLPHRRMRKDLALRTTA